MMHFLILLPKSPEANRIKDYRLISPIHMIGKLISKILANRFALRLGSLVHSSQSAFVNGRSIHDSFWFIQASARLLFVNKKPSILFKADILKAFDLVAWSFLMEILGHLGFSNVWINWGTKVLLNGALGS
jgi:hypothetical protein